MDYTPFDNLTNDEIIRHALNDPKKDALTISLINRIIDLRTEVQDLKTEIRELATPSIVEDAVP